MLYEVWAGNGNKGRRSNRGDNIRNAANTSLKVRSDKTRAALLYAAN